MSVNSSSFLSFLVHPSNILSSCFDSTTGNLILSIFTSTSIIFLLPLCVVILYLGHQQPSASASTCDLITCNVAVMEMICILASVSYCIGVHVGLLRLVMVATVVFFTAECGQMCYHNIMCIECYLAVVHPVTYLQMKNGHWIRIRNIIVWCVWLLGCAMMGLVALNSLDVILIVYFVQLAWSVVVVSFCCLSVLRVLKRQGPGEASEDRERVDQPKQRAFFTIMAVTGTLLLRCGGNLVCIAIFKSPQISRSSQCVAVFSGSWLNLPSSLVTPLLFLHRAGKLPCCRSNSESGHGSSQ